MVKLLAGVVAALVACAASGQTELTEARAPLTGRAQQFTFSQADNFAVAEKAHAQRLVWEKERIVLEGDLVARTTRITERLIAAAVGIHTGAANWQWGTLVINSEDVNLQAGASGKLLIGAPFVEGLALTDEELAMALAHEVAHVVCEHSREILSKVPDVVKPLYVMTAEMAAGAFTEDLLVATSLTAEFKGIELEADLVGLAIYLLAGYPAEAAFGLFDKLAQHEAGQGSGIPVGGAHDQASARKALLRVRAAAMHPTLTMLSR